jgi:ferredoxin
VQRVTAAIIEGRGHQLLMSALPVDGFFPTGTARFEKRGIADMIPIWDKDLCIQCAKCAIVCPHAAIRTKVFEEKDLAATARPGTFETLPWKGSMGGDFKGMHMRIQVAPDDCTGCGICVDVCPARSKTEVKHKAINMTPRLDHLDVEQKNFDFFVDVPEVDRRKVDRDSRRPGVREDGDRPHGLARAFADADLDPVLALVERDLELEAAVRAERLAKAVHRTSRTAASPTRPDTSTAYPRLPGRDNWNSRIDAQVFHGADGGSERSGCPARAASRSSSTAPEGLLGFLTEFRTTWRAIDGIQAVHPTRGRRERRVHVSARSGASP